MAFNLTPALFGQMGALTDPLRSRILHVLDRNELTVSELCQVFQSPQSTMSRHLKALSDEGWLTVRPEGTSRRYIMNPDLLAPEVKRLWRLVRDQVVAMPAADQDAERLRSVLADRRSRSQEFFSTVAGQWDKLREEMIGRRLDLLGLLGLLDDRWVVGDLGCGTGQIAEILSRTVSQVIAVDDSDAMLSAARERLQGVDNVEIRGGDLNKLPIEDLKLDAAVIFMVMHYLDDPATVLRETARVLKPDGRVVIVDLAPHAREEYRQTMGHQWLGFGKEELGNWVREAGMEAFNYTLLPADPEAMGPMLITATARTPREEMWIPGSIE